MKALGLRTGLLNGLLRALSPMINGSQLGTRTEHVN